MLGMDTPLPTPSGWATIGDVQAGDALFDERGEVCRVVKVHPIDLRPESYRLTFSNGEQIKACADHLWLTTARIDRPGAGIGARQDELFAGRPRGSLHGAIVTRLRTTRELFATQAAGGRGDHNHCVRLPLPLRLPERALPVEPYTLGFWLGDGESAAARVTVGDRDADFLLGQIAPCGRPKRGKARAAAYSLLGRSPALRPFFGDKHVPADYLRASYGQRLALLQGLMDTDGHASKAGQCEFASSNPELLEQVRELLATFGIKAVPKWRETACKPACRLLFFTDQPVFRLPRKLARLKPAVKRARTVQVVSVERIAPEPMRCITVDSPSGLYLCGRSMLPTHNTPLAAGVAVYVFFCDGEAGQQSYIAAGDAEQAGLLFRQCRGMIQAEPALSKRCRIYGGGGQQVRSVVKPDNSFLRVVSAAAETKHGGNTHLAIVDELHVQPDRDLLDVLSTSMASHNRKQPLLIQLTTADYVRESICNEKYNYAKQVRDGLVVDPAFLPAVWEATPADPWVSPETWAKANPNLGVSVSREYFERECRRAQELPSCENTFKRLHLNLQTGQDVRWIPMESWDACAGAVDAAALAGRECYAGLDLASTTDLCALALLFPGVDGFDVLPFFWAPAGADRRRERGNKARLGEWQRRGLIEATPGDVTDYAAIRKKVNDLGKTYRIRELAFDRWNASQLITELGEHDGVSCVGFGQGYASMSAPMKELESLLLSGRIRHGGDPVLRWMASNVAATLDPAGNVKPDRARSADKIDGVVALVMALGRAMLREGPSVYEARGVLTLGGGPGAEGAPAPAPAFDPWADDPEDD